MVRHELRPRDGWQKLVEKEGFLFHSPDNTTYWNEAVCYEFSGEEIETLESATNSLQEICAKAVEKIITQDWYARLGISALEAQLIANSWEHDHLSIYGRFDLSWRSGSAPKMLEYNADTPTSLLEASVIQWNWLQQTHPTQDQFNSIHDKLIRRWKHVADPHKKLFFTCLQGHADDISQTEYLRDTCHQAGFNTEFIFIEDLGYDSAKKRFVGFEETPVEQCFKLYPWEWLTRESFGEHILSSQIKLIEPAWKRIMSTKAFSAILWELFPEHPNLLPSYFEKPVNGKFVEKPFISREGQRIGVWDNGSLVSRTDGDIEAEGSVFQAYHELPNFRGKYPVIGSWVIGEESAGIGIREDAQIITQSSSHFIPHYINTKRR